MTGRRAMAFVLGCWFLASTGHACQDEHSITRAGVPEDPPVVARATLQVSTAGGEPRLLEIPGIAAEDGIVFRGEHHDPTEAMTVRWNWKADLDPRGRARIAGLASILNLASDKRTFDVRVSMPLDPLVDHATRIGGRVRLTLVMDEGGGRLDIPPGDSVWSAMIDGSAARSLHAGPFAMGGATAGTMVADDDFGAPFPSFEAAAAADGFGIRHRFRLTGGDEARFHSELILEGDEAHFRRRPREGPIRIGPSRGAKGPMRIDPGRGGKARPRELEITPIRPLRSR